MSVIVNINHETADLGQYDSSTTDGNKLSVTTGAALVGSYGMSVLIDSTNEKYAYKNTGYEGSTLRVRFYIDPNAITMPDTSSITVMRIVQDGGSYLALVNAYLDYFTSGGYKLKINYKADGGWNYGSDYVITDAPHYMEILVVSAATSISSDGTTQMWIDGVSQFTATGLDNYNSMQDVNWRAVLGAMVVSASISGTYYLDELIVNNDGGLIGPCAYNPIASIDHETGNLTQYTSTTGTVSVTGAAALASTSYGLSVLINSTAYKIGFKSLNEKPTTVRARFYFNPNSITAPTDDSFDMFAFQQDDVTYYDFAYVYMAWNATDGYYLYAGYETDDLTGHDGNHKIISNASHYTEITVTQAATSISSDGTFQWWIDGISQESITGIDNYNLMSDQNIRIKIGAWNFGAAWSGTIYIDEIIVSDNDSPIGPHGVSNPHYMKLLRKVHIP